MSTPRGNSIQQGIGLCFLLHLLQVLLLFGTEAVFVLFIGITQLAYVVPASVMILIRKRYRTLGGIWIGAGITAALNALVLLFLAQARIW